MNTKFITLILIVFTFVLGTGCTPEPQIVRHKIPKSRSGLEKLRENQDSKDSTQPKQKTTRMAVAIFENPNATWFVKLVGPIAQVDSTEQQWTSFFETVRFEDGDPVWELPEGWSASGPRPMRFETLVIGDYQPPLEVAISQLGPNQDLLLNVNRWRVQQLGLPPATQDDLDEMLKKHKSTSSEFLVFDTLGFGSGRMTPPFARGAAPMNETDRTTPETSTATALSFDVPEGWTASDVSSIVHARLKKIIEGAEAQITIIELTPNNEWPPNVQRWAGEVGLGGLSAEQFAERTSELTVDGITGKLIDLVDMESETTNATMAGMFKHDGSAWFLKLTGDKQMVNDSRDVFKQFIDSVHFR